jgi:hypothetical protein
MLSVILISLVMLIAAMTLCFYREYNACRMNMTSGVKQCFYIECHYDEGHYYVCCNAEYHYEFVILSVITLSNGILNVILLIILH